MRKKLNFYESFLLLGGIIVTLLILFIGKTYDWISLLATFSTITNIICVVLCAKRKISNYIWGTFGVISYGIVAFASNLTGEWMLNLLYYFPMQIYGFICWKKHLNISTNSVKPRYLTKLKMVGILFGTAISIFVYALFISLPSVQIFLYNTISNHSFGKYLIDSSAVMLSIWAMVLMAKCYQFQWWLWIAVDFLTVVLWAIEGNWIVLVQWVIFTLNAFYGLVNWKEGRKDV